MTVRGKKKIVIRMDADLADEFRKHIIDKYGTIHALSVVFERIIKEYLFEVEHEVIP